jgi:hypothetical protein
MLFLKGSPHINRANSVAKEGNVARLISPPLATERPCTPLLACEYDEVEGGQIAWYRSESPMKGM